MKDWLRGVFSQIFLMPFPSPEIEADAEKLLADRSPEEAWWEARRRTETAEAMGNRPKVQHWTRVKWTIARRTGYSYHGDTATRYLD